MIEISGLNKSYGKKMLFCNYNLKIERGEFVVFSGVSGCGKTTLLNMIGGLEAVDSGKILIDGFDVSKKQNKVLFFRNKVGFLFQNFALIENKTVLENLQIIRKRHASEVSIDSALKRVGLENNINDKIYTLSGGEQQRVALARLMIKKCDLVLADEPTGSLDKENSSDVMNILEQMKKKGKTIIVVTHDEEVKKFGERIIEL